MSKGTKTAAELMAELRSTPGFVTQQQQREEQRLRGVEEARRAAAPVLAELAQIGFSVSSVAELPQKGNIYESAIPTLLRWLPSVSHAGVKESIVRALSVPFAKPNAGPLLVEEFRRATADQAALKWAIGNALEVVADDAVFDEVATLVRDKAHAKAREMLAVALGNMSNPRAVDVLVDLLNDDEVSGHAIMGLGKLRARKARAAIEPFLKHAKPWIRKEAKKAIAMIDKSKRIAR